MSSTDISSLLVTSVAISLGGSCLVVIESTLEYKYMLVTRELVHGPHSAWQLMESFRPFRRAAEIAFACSILLWPAVPRSPPQSSSQTQSPP